MMIHKEEQLEEEMGMVVNWQIYFHPILRLKLLIIIEKRNMYNIGQIIRWINLNQKLQIIKVNHIQK